MFRLQLWSERLAATPYEPPAQLSCSIICCHSPLRARAPAIASQAAVLFAGRAESSDMKQKGPETQTNGYRVPVPVAGDAVTGESDASSCLKQSGEVQSFTLFEMN